MKLINALHCRNEGRPPVWLMRQAGRYMPQYRAIRAKHSFLEMCHDPELATRVTMLPVELLGVDAAILFSDILMIVEALGVGLRFEETKGPIIERPLKGPEDVAALPRPNMQEKLGFVGSAIRAIRAECKVPLLGFCGAPFTVASYMIEGGSSRDFKKTKQWLLRDPESFHKLLQHLTDCTLEYMHLQADAGVQALQIFDSWAHALPHEQFRSVCLPYMTQLVEGFKVRKIPVILFCRGSSLFAADLVEAKPAAISVDWSGHLGKVRLSVPGTIAIQGNLDPDMLYAPQKMLQSEVRRLLKLMKLDKGYIFNLGHGIHPDVSMDAVKLLVDTVQNA